jgi:hypothetical protein
MSHKQAYATPTSVIIRKMRMTDNPVTKSTYYAIIGNRIDRLELNRLKEDKK